MSHSPGLFSTTPAACRTAASSTTRVVHAISRRVCAGRQPERRLEVAGRAGRAVPGQLAPLARLHVAEVPADSVGRRVVGRVVGAADEGEAVWQRRGQHDLMRRRRAVVRHRQPEQAGELRVKDRRAGGRHAQAVVLGAADAFALNWRDALGLHAERAAQVAGPRRRRVEINGSRFAGRQGADSGLQVRAFRVGQAFSQEGVEGHVVRGDGAVVAYDDPISDGLADDRRVGSGHAEGQLRPRDLGGADAGGAALERGVHRVARRGGRLAGLRHEAQPQRRLLPRPEAADAPDQAVGGPLRRRGHSQQLVAGGQLVRRRHPLRGGASGVADRDLDEERRPRFDAVRHFLVDFEERLGHLCRGVRRERQGRDRGADRRRSADEDPKRCRHGPPPSPGDAPPGARSNRSRRRRRVRTPNAVLPREGRPYSSPPGRDKRSPDGPHAGKSGEDGEGRRMVPRLSFPSSAWERLPRNSVSRPVQGPDAKRSFADVRSQAELGNEGDEGELGREGSVGAGWGRAAYRFIGRFQMSYICRWASAAGRLPFRCSPASGIGSP